MIKNRFDRPRKTWILATALMVLIGAVSVARAVAPKAAGQAAHAASPAAEQTGAEHEEIDERLVPLPPSKDTIVSAIWVLVIFVLMLIILYPLAWKPVLAGLKKREERIRGDIAAAEEQRRRAEATLKQYNEQLAGAEARIRDMLNKAQSEGEQLATSIRMQAQKEAEDAKDRAQRDIEASKNAAIREVHAQTAELATSIAAKILRRNLNLDDQRELVRQSLEQLQTIK